jgi:hypothetical protein
MSFWLRQGEQRFELTERDVVVGRGREADIVLKDRLVSRRHASFTLRQNEVIVEDLGSGNGVFVNGRRIQAATALRPGDIIFVGRNRLEIGMGEASSPPSVAEHRSVRPRDPESEFPSSTQRQDALDLLGAMAEHALSRGRLEQAESTLADYLTNFLSLVTSAGAAPFGNPEKAAWWALRLAETTGKASWIDYVYELYAALGRLLPDPLVDQLAKLLRRLQPGDPAALAKYIAALRAGEPELDNHDRMRLARIASLAP